MLPVYLRHLRTSSRSSSSLPILFFLSFLPRVKCSVGSNEPTTVRPSADAASSPTSRPSHFIHISCYNNSLSMDGLYTTTYIFLSLRNSVPIQRAGALHTQREQESITTSVRLSVCHSFGFDTRPRHIAAHRTLLTSSSVSRIPPCAHTRPFRALPARGWPCTRAR